jgi:hypothetical protein
MFAGSWTWLSIMYNTIRYETIDHVPSTVGLVCYAVFLVMRLCEFSEIAQLKITQISMRITLLAQMVVGWLGARCIHVLIECHALADVTNYIIILHYYCIVYFLSLHNIWSWKSHNFNLARITYQSYGSCIVVMAHVVKDRQCRMLVPQSQRRSLRPTLDLDSDKFRCFNHRDELDSAVQLLNFRSVGRGTLRYMRAIHSTRLALFSTA